MRSRGIGGDGFWDRGAMVPVACYDAIPGRTMKTESLAKNGVQQALQAYYLVMNKVRRYTSIDNHRRLPSRLLPVQSAFARLTAHCIQAGYLHQQPLPSTPDANTRESW